MRRLLVGKTVTLRFSDHAVVEARKDGLTVEDLEEAVANGEVIEDYGIRVLLLAFTRDDALPYHVVVEYVAGADKVTIVTAYVPDAKEWEPNWKKRRRRRRR